MEAGANPLCPRVVSLTVFITAIGTPTKALCADHTADIASLSEEEGGEWEAACFFSISAHALEEKGR